MISEDKFGLRPIWEATFSIYQQVAAICDRHGLRYYATDGTAIGAVRHKGFIPWDDDFDISMPRPDYEKFKKIAAEELPENLKWVDWHNSPEMSVLFGKVHDCRKEVVLALEEKVGRTLSNGVYIDIFPIDGYPPAAVSRLWIKICTVIPKCIIRFKSMKLNQQTSKGKVIWLFGALFSALLPWVSKERCMQFFERMLLKYGFDDCEFTGRSCSLLTVLRRAPLARGAWGRPTPHEFEDSAVMLPEDFDAHLRNEYVKFHYMTLPPESCRYPSHSYSWRCPWWLGPTKEVGEMCNAEGVYR